MRSTLALFVLAQPALAQYSYGNSYGSSYSSGYGSYSSTYNNYNGYGNAPVRYCDTNYNSNSLNLNSANICNLDETCVAGVCLKSRGAAPAPQRPCNVDYDCGGAQKCAGGVCVASSWRCSRNTDCNVNEACLGGSCQPLYPSNPPGSSYWCNADSQCTVYEKCKDYHCVRCQAGECLNRGSLNPCWNDNQCLLAETCVQGLCQTKQCKTDNQCGYTEVCSPTTQTCVDCTSSMVNGAVGTYDPTYYGSSTTSCKGTGSGYWCYSDSQCPMNEVCDNSYCRSTGPPVPFQCTTDAQCGLNQRCNAGLCAAVQSQRFSCILDSDCAYNQVCQSAVCVSGGYAAWVPHN